MIISPRGKILAQAEGADGLAIADIDPRGGREGGDSSNTQKDMRARLFRERNPEAFKILTEPNPPVLAKVPIDITREEAGRIFARMLTVGEEEFKQAAALARAGKTKEAIAAFEKLRAEYRGTWIDRVAQGAAGVVARPSRRSNRPRLGEPPAKKTEDPVKPAPKEGLASLYPGDAGIERDPRVILVENFEHDSLDALAKRWETVSGRDTMALSNDRPTGSAGKQSLLIDREKGAAGQLYRRLKNPKGGWGYDQVFARYYVKFDPDCGEIHHFGTTIGGNHPATPWPMVRAGTRPDGAKSFWSGIEPFGAAWTWDYYTYWCEMRGSPPRGQTWGNTFIRDPKLKVEKGKWICIEQMIKLNDVGDTNGEQALWIDGKQVSHLGKGFPKGLWIFDKFNPGQGGTGVRWSDAKGEREQFPVPKDGAPFEGFRWRTDQGTERELCLALRLHLEAGRPPHQGVVRRRGAGHRIHRPAGRQEALAEPGQADTLWIAGREVPTALDTQTKHMRAPHLDAEVHAALGHGLVIPACPLALNRARKLDERRQRALIRYYLEAGAGGLAVGVHTTQFAIRDPQNGLFRPLLELAAEEMDRADRRRAEPVVRIAGVCGPTPQALAEAELVRACGYHAGLLSLGGLKNASEKDLIAHCRAGRRGDSRWSASTSNRRRAGGCCPTPSGAGWRRSTPWSRSRSPRSTATRPSTWCGRSSRPDATTWPCTRATTTTSSWTC